MSIQATASLQPRVETKPGTILSHLENLNSSISELERFIADLGGEAAGRNDIDKAPSEHNPVFLLVYSQLPATLNEAVGRICDCTERLRNMLI